MLYGPALLKPSFMLIFVQMPVYHFQSFFIFHVRISIRTIILHFPFLFNRCKHALGSWRNPSEDACVSRLVNHRQRLVYAVDGRRWNSCHQLHEGGVWLPVFAEVRCFCWDRSLSVMSSWCNERIWNLFHATRCFCQINIYIFFIYLCIFCEELIWWEIMWCKMTCILFSNIGYLDMLYHDKNKTLIATWSERNPKIDFLGFCPSINLDNFIYVEVQ